MVQPPHGAAIRSSQPIWRTANDPRMAVEAELLTWSDITGIVPTPSLLRDRLAAFALDTVLVILAQVAAVRQTWRNDPACERDQELSDELLPSYRTRINAIRRPHHIAFSRIGILY